MKSKTYQPSRENSTMPLVDPQGMNNMPADVVMLSRAKGHTRNVGDTARQAIVISRQMVEVYAALTGDKNPIHLDEGTGKASIFGTNIAHGMLVGSLFGPLMVNHLLGPGIIYRKQTLEFEAPVPLDETVTAVVTVREVHRKPDKDVYILDTECFLSDGIRALHGEAVVLALKDGLKKPSRT
jgi:acyl dehydratase